MANKRRSNAMDSCICASRQSSVRSETNDDRKCSQRLEEYGVQSTDIRHDQSINSLISYHFKQR